MIPRFSAFALPLLLILPACGGGGPSTGPTTQPSEPTYSVTATLFYDENGNGLLDANEAVRLPGIDVVVGSATGKSGPGGQAVVAGVKAGSQAVAIRTEAMRPKDLARVIIDTTV